MKIEHIAFPASDPVAVAAWYVAHFGLRVVRETGAPTYTHFLADETESVFEIYNNPLVSVPDYASMHPLLLHIAFEVDNIEATYEHLLAEGCTAFEAPNEYPNGDWLAMLLDPWGLAIQLVKRAVPFDTF